jgi:hypothetical protein
MLDETTTVLDINGLLISKEEWSESFVSDITVKDIIREIPE